jgi:hypothetical protein
MVVGQDHLREELVEGPGHRDPLERGFLEIDRDEAGDEYVGVRMEADEGNQGEDSGYRNAQPPTHYLPALDAR